MKITSGFHIKMECFDKIHNEWIMKVLYRPVFTIILHVSSFKEFYRHFAKIECLSVYEAEKMSFYFQVRLTIYTLNIEASLIFSQTLILYRLPQFRGLNRKVLISKIRRKTIKILNSALSTYIQTIRLFLTVLTRIIFVQY